MKLIIDIDEETYKKCKWKNNGVVGLEWWESAIANGTPIPKGHGRLIDADRLKDTVEYALLQHEDAEKWFEWINQVIDAEPTVEDIKDCMKTEKRNDDEIDEFIAFGHEFNFAPDEWWDERE